jgi:hypothetical protein
VDERKTIRLRIAYRSAEAALRELTRNVQRGYVTLETRRPVEPGTRFVFELHGTGVDPPAEVAAEIVELHPTTDGAFSVKLKYKHGEHRQGLDALLRHVFDAQKQDRLRRAPRLPLNVRATEAQSKTTTYVVRDLSTGGLGIEIEAKTLPSAVHVGAAFLLEIDLPNGVMPLHGEISWIASALTKEGAVRPSFGVSFGKLRAVAQDTVKRLLTHRGLPPPPWSARVSFGMDAISRMP